MLSGTPGGWRWIASVLSLVGMSMFPFLAQPIAGTPRTTEIRQCGAPGACSAVAYLSYDASGNLTRAVDPLGQENDFTYDPLFNRLTSLRDARGNSSSFHPTCGTLYGHSGFSRSHCPLISASPWQPGASLLPSNSHCSPRQMPSSGRPRSITPIIASRHSWSSAAVC